MLLSMTGFGQSRRERDDLVVSVEVRTVNNRYLKVNVKLPEAYAALEGELERLVRSEIGRGTITVSVRVQRITGTARTGFDAEVVNRYWQEIQQLATDLHAVPPPDISILFALPGVVRTEDDTPVDVGRDRPLFEEALREALERLNEFRVTEGRSSAADLSEQVAVVGRRLGEIGDLAPGVVSAQRDRILERVGEYLAAHDVQLQPSDLIREVAVFADRCDVNEEITRLRSHLEQFEVFLADDQSQGRKLDFLTQEMFREVNTIGSKANNVEIAHLVVEMKTAVERIREILQNVE